MVKLVPLAAGEEVVLKKKKSTCSVCGENRLAPLLNLPNFPLTGIYLKDPSEGQKYPGIDQGFVLCRDCGHGQLLYAVDPKYLYLDTYSHRSSLSPIATTGNDFFARFLEEVTKGKTFERIVEVGCNDLYLLRKVEAKANRLLGIDPVWQGKDHEVSAKIKVRGGFLGEVDIVEELGGKPDLILSAHTFEHIDNPRIHLQNLIDAAQDEALFVLEVPCLDTLLVISRFDQIFHQHIQYFSLASFLRLIQELGGEYLQHTFNYGYWGGTMLFAFKKAHPKILRHPVDNFSAPTEARVMSSYQRFRDQLAHLMKLVELPELRPLYGFGAAQMVPTLAYHMKSDLSFLRCILDDDPRRCDRTYPHLPVWIRKPVEDLTLEGVTVMITALDSVRPILKRAMSLGARRILTPLNLF